MDIESIKIFLQDLIERAGRPMFNPLEVGFRHSGLSTSESLNRYKDFCEEVKLDCEAFLKEMDK